MSPSKYMTLTPILAHHSVKRSSIRFWSCYMGQPSWFICPLILRTVWHDVLVPLCNVLQTRFHHGALHNPKMEPPVRGSRKRRNVCRGHLRNPCWQEIQRNSSVHSSRSRPHSEGSELDLCQFWKRRPPNASWRSPQTIEARCRPQLLRSTVFCSVEYVLLHV